MFDDDLRRELHEFVIEKMLSKEIKLLNVGSDRMHEAHWRFRTLTGKIVTIRVECEEES
jgi:hypothetical protein